MPLSTRLVVLDTAPLQGRKHYGIAVDPLPEHHGLHQLHYLSSIRRFMHDDDDQLNHTKSLCKRGNVQVPTNQYFTSYCDADVRLQRELRTLSIFAGTTPTSGICSAIASQTSPTVALPTIHLS